jgi:hypothetical protein
MLRRYALIAGQSKPIIGLNMFTKNSSSLRRLGVILAGIAVMGLSSCSSQPVKPADAMPGKGRTQPLRLAGHQQ